MLYLVTDVSLFQLELQSFFKKSFQNPTACFQNELTTGVKPA